MSLIRFAAFSALVLPLTASATDLVVDAPCLSEPFVLSLDDLTYEETLESRGVFLGVYGMPPTMMEGALRFPLVTWGKIDESATLSPSTPITRHSGSTTAIGSSARPIRQVPQGW